MQTNLQQELEAALALEQELIGKLAKTHGVVDFLVYAIKQQQADSVPKTDGN